MDTLRARTSLQAKEEVSKLRDVSEFYNRVGDRVKLRELHEAKGGNFSSLIDSVRKREGQH